MRRYRQRLKRSRPDQKTLAKQQRRAEREIALAEATKRAAETLGSKLYGVIYMDPAPRFEPYSRETGLDRAADDHYTTQVWNWIAAMTTPGSQGLRAVLLEHPRPTGQHAPNSLVAVAGLELLLRRKFA